MKRILYLITLLTIVSCNSKNSDKILFSSNRNGSSDIFLMDSDGKEIKSLINTEAEEWGATFINDKNITFMRQIKDSVFRFQYNLTTNKEIALSKLSNCYLDDKNVIYSINGDYTYSCGNGFFLKENSKSKERKLISIEGGFCNYLAWSFDGSKIIYTNSSNGNKDIYTYDIYTNKIENLTNHPANDERGEISPDGNLLVFSSNRHNKNDQDIFILNLRTLEIENISNSKGYDLIGRWSSDGKRVLYGSNKDGNWEIYSYKIDDKSTTRLTNNKAFDGDPRIR